MAPISHRWTPWGLGFPDYLDDAHPHIEPFSSIPLLPDPRDWYLGEYGIAVFAQAKKYDRTALNLLETITGVGTILAYTLLYETHTISRFLSPQAFFPPTIGWSGLRGVRVVGYHSGWINTAGLDPVFVAVVTHKALAELGLEGEET